MKAPRLSSGAKTAIFILGVLFLGILGSSLRESDSNHRNETDLSKRRRLEVFYRTFPVIQHLWSASLVANSLFTVTEIRSHQAEVGYTVGSGLLWGEDRDGMIGQMSFRFFHSKDKVEADSFWIEIFMPTKRVHEIQNDPHDYSFESKPMFQKQREAFAKTWKDSRPIATLGEDAQRKLRQLPKGESDTFVLGGMEWILSLDKKNNLRVLLRGSLTSGMFPTSSLRSYVRSARFGLNEGNDLWRVLRERAFVDEVYVSSFLPTNDGQNDHPYMRLVAVLPNGNAYIVGFSSQSSSYGNKLRFLVANEQTRIGNGATEDFRDEFRAFLERSQGSSRTPGRASEVDTSSQYFIRQDDMKQLAETGTYPTFKKQR